MKNWSVISIAAVTLFAGISLGHLFTPKKDVAYEQLLEGQLKYEKGQVESYKQKMINAQRRDSVWMSIEMQYKDSLKHSRNEAYKWKRIYDDIKNTPTPKFNESELDSLIGSIIR